jgi:RNA polymerase sigma factor for flagellar operon FliA
VTLQTNTGASGSQSSPSGRSRVPDREFYERYLPLVRRIAMRTVRSLPPSLTIDDVVAAGWVGMTEALQRRTPDVTEEQFKAYASYRVRGAILDYLRVLDPLSRKLRGASRRITEVAQELTKRLGRSPDEAETAAEMGLSLTDYQELLTDISNAGLVRLELSAITEPASSEASPEALTSRKEAVDAIAEAIDELPQRLQLVLGLHYQEECSLREIGEILGVTESRVCQLHAQAVHLIRARLEGASSRKGRPRRS